MEKINVKDRLTYLAETFDVFECNGEDNSVDKKIKLLGTPPPPPPSASVVVDFFNFS